MRLTGILGFEWDEANRWKNERKHGITALECEEIFHNTPLIIVFDHSHSQIESRFAALGQTKANVPLFVTFTVRGKRIRVISARPMSRQERRLYEKENADR